MSSSFVAPLGAASREREHAAVIDTVLAIDIGATKLEAALVSRSGVVHRESRVRRPTGPETNAELMGRALDEAIAEALAHVPDTEARIAVGVGTAGPIDTARGSISPVNMPRLSGFPIVEYVSEALTSAGRSGAPVAVRLDGACIALAEAWVGAARDVASSMTIVVSTGIGGGIVMDGRLVPGPTGNAGHLGHTHIEDSGVGIPLEEIAAGPASVRWARDRGWDGVSGEDLGRDASASHSIARAAIVRSATAVGYALADAATLLELELVAIGGGFSRVSPDYVDLVQSALRGRAKLTYAQKTRVVRSGLGEDGPLVGAASLVTSELSSPHTHFQAP